MVYIIVQELVKIEEDILTHMRYEIAKYAVHNLNVQKGQNKDFVATLARTNGNGLELEYLTRNITVWNEHVNIAVVRYMSSHTKFLLDAIYFVINTADKRGIRKYSLRAKNGKMSVEKEP